MPPRISKRVREEAAMLCSMAVSNHRLAVVGCACLGCLVRAAGVDWTGYELAYDAWVAAGWRYAEAECLLRTGWVP